MFIPIHQITLPWKIHKKPASFFIERKKPATVHDWNRF